MSATPDDAATPVRFRSTIVSGGSTTTGVLIPPEVVEALGGGKQPLVAITVGTHAYRGMIATRGGRSLVSLSAENRGLAGVGAGDEVDVELALDTAPRTVEVPDDLAVALDASPGARAFFDGLTARGPGRPGVVAPGGPDARSGTSAPRQRTADTPDGPNRAGSGRAPAPPRPVPAGALVFVPESIHPYPWGQGIRWESGTDAQR